MANRWVKVEAVTDFILGGSKITVNGHCSYKIKMHTPLMKAMTNSIFKSRDIILPTNVHVVQAMVFPVVMYGCESRTIKKAEHWRINAFKLQCWRRLLKVSWTAKISNQSILREIKPEYSLEGLILSFQYFGHLMWRANSMQKTLILGKMEGRRRRGWQRMRWFNSITDYRDMSLSKLWEVVKGRETWHGVIPAVANSQTQISDWKTTNSLS